MAASIAALGATPAQAETNWVPCDSPAIGPWCDAVDRQVDHVQGEAAAAVDYVVYVGDTAIAKVNETYNTVKCLIGECP